MFSIILSYVTDALISSELQINQIDKRFNSDSKVHPGTDLKLIALEIKNSIQHTGKIIDTFKTISQICSMMKNGNMFGDFLSVLFEDMYLYLLENYDGFIQQNAVECNAMNLYSNQTESHPDSDVIIIDSDGDESSIDEKIIESDSTSDIIWINAMKYALKKVNINNDVLDELKYINIILHGFKNCLLQAIYIVENDYENSCMKSQLTLLTNLLENMKIGYDENQESNLILYRDGYPNPSIQILATSFRAIIEAIKLFDQ